MLASLDAGLDGCAQFLEVFVEVANAFRQFVGRHLVLIDGPAEHGFRHRNCGNLLVHVRRMENTLE